MQGRCPIVALLLCAAWIGGVGRSEVAWSDSARGIPVLLYHEIVRTDKEPGETVIPFEKFAAQMQYLHDHDYTAISMTDLINFMQGGEVPERAVVLTFDDGWKSALNAVPVLRQYGFKASFWIITEKGIGWDYMEWTDIVALDRDSLFDVGCHSATHPWDPEDNIVTWLDGDNPGKSEADVEHELVDSKRTLEARLGRAVPYFAWPCGWYTDSLIVLAQNAGYSALLTAEEGLNHAGDDVYRIRRTFIDGACDFSAFVSALETGSYTSCQASGRVTRGNMPERVKK